MAKRKDEGDTFECPVGRFFSDMEKIAGRKSKFFKHMSKSRIEFLKAVRSLVDERIETLEKQDSSKARKRATKIKVE
jgi:hypothetical protein